MKLRLRRRLRAEAFPATWGGFSWKLRGLWPIEHSEKILSVASVADIDAAAATRQDDRRWFPARESKGNAVRALQHNAAAAPATVSGEPAT
jgi:hypothetical protein